MNGPLDAIFRLFALSGTARRLHALIAVLIYVIVLVGLQVVQNLDPARARFAFPLLGLASVVMFATLVRRLHHAGITGRWALVALLPLLGLVAAFIITFLPQKKTYLNAHNGARAAGYLGMALLMFWALWRVWWAPYWIPSESMKPTMLVGDYFIAGQSGARDVGLGDVIVARHPVTGNPVIKRLMGVAGDTIAVQNGAVWRNGAPLQQLPNGTFAEVMAPQGPEAVRPRCENAPVGDGAECRKSRLREVLNADRSYEVLNIETGSFGDNFAQVTVPEGSVFLLGDNRDNSMDSRYAQGVGGLGFVPESHVIGPVRRILFSAAGPALVQVWTWRANRFLQKVR